jgi:hypothetical protein
MFRRARLASLVCLVAINVGVVSLAGCMSSGADDEDVAESEDNLTEQSNALVLKAANTLDEDTLDLEVGLGESDARAIVKRRPFARIEQLRAFLSARQIRLLLDYARQHGLRPSPSASGSASAWPSPSGSGSPSPSPSGSGSAIPDAGGYDATPFLPRDAGGQ